MNSDFNQAELLEHPEWYRDRSLQAAKRFIIEVETALQKICAAPERNQPLRDGVRVLRLKRFPFRLYYLPGPDRLTLYGIKREHTGC